jgi:hypothetical protein
VSYVSEVEVDKPLVWYRIDDAGSETEGAAVDKGSLKQNGVYHGVVKLVTGAISGDTDKAGEFPNNSADYISVANVAALAALTETFTFEMWLSPAAKATFYAAFQKGNTAEEEGEGVSLVMDATLKLIVVAKGATQIIAPALTLGAYSHVVLTYGTGTLKLYRNAVLIGEKAMAGPIPTFAGPIRIGGRLATSQPWNGRIDEVAVYSTALNLTRIEAHYLASKISGLTVFGHSYGEGAMPENETFRQTKLVATKLGKAEDNNAVGGSYLTVGILAEGHHPKGGYSTVLEKYAPSKAASPWTTTLSYVYLIWGINDWCFLGKVNFPILYPPCLELVINRLRCSAIFEDTHASVTYPKNSKGENQWAEKVFEVGLFSGTTMHFMVEEEAELEIKTPATYGGQAITIATVVSPTITSGTMLAKNEAGTTVSNTLNIGTLGKATIFGATKIEGNTAVGIRIPAGTLSAGAQTIKVVYAGCPAGHTANVWFDWWGIEAESPPIILIENALRLTATGYGNEEGGEKNRVEELTDAGVKQIQEVQTAVAAKYNKVFVGNPDPSINKNTADFLAEQVHPNATGAAIIAGAMFASIPGESSTMVVSVGHKRPHIR